MIASILAQKYPELKTVFKNKEEAAQMIKLACNLNRSWQKVLQNHPELRGDDYSEKEVLEQTVEVELGYTPGFHQDVKKLKQIYEED